MPLLIFAVLIVLALIALMPVSLVLRYRRGTSRRRARGWVVTVNVLGMMLSVALFLTGAAFTSVWVPNAFTYSAAGLITGSVLGLVGLLLTRWEFATGSLYYTPNRWLVLGITLIVTARIAYGMWRGWETWRGEIDGSPWLAASSVAGSMAAGALVLGYYVVYWWGVRRRFRQLALEGRHRTR